jgi:membrane-associated phospholipid phosphatase
MNLLRDQKAIWTSPAHVGPGDIWWLGSLAGATAGLIATDRQTGDAMAKHPEWVDPSIAISYAGSGYTAAAVAGTFYLTGRLTHDSRATETGLLGAEAVLNTAIVTSVVKGVTRRARPDAGDDRGKFFVGGTSFPSGHAGSVWSFATVVASEYHDRTAVVIASYSIASLASMARFTAQRHYLSDVLVGSAVGFGVGRYTYRVHHFDAAKTGTATGAPANRGGTGKWPLISPQLDRGAKAYRIGLTWIY